MSFLGGDNIPNFEFSSEGSDEDIEKYQQLIDITNQLGRDHAQILLQTYKEAFDQYMAWFPQTPSSEAHIFARFIVEQLG